MPKALLTIFLFITFFSFCYSQDIDTTMWVTDSPVSSIARSGNTIYIAGFFRHVGPNTGSGVILNRSDGKLASAPLLKINGIVRASISDGKGGWFIGGDFTQVGGVIRNRLAHILANGNLDPTWNPDANAAIHILAMNGNVIYAGGDFTTIGGQTRNSLAALDITTGQATDWNPSPNYRVSTLAIVGNVVYAGGSFTSIGGQSRNFLAALDVTTGQATDWNPNSNNAVNTLAIADNVVYVGGYFNRIGDQFRNLVAALDITTGQATSWNPNVNDGSYIHTLAVSRNVVYIGGGFTGIGGKTRNNLAALDIITGQVTDWNPNSSNKVNTLSIVDNVIYAGGEFTTIGGQTRNSLAALNATTGQVTDWNPNPNLRVNTLSIAGNAVYAGGDFTSICGETRIGLAALNATTGQVTDWNPNPKNGNVHALAVSNNLVYIGGTFTSIGGQPRNNLAVFDATTGQITGWNPDPDSWIYAIAVSRSLVYVGGYFNRLGGQSRNYLAALDATTGQPTDWNPDPNNVIRQLVIAENVVYVAGDFIRIGGQMRNRLAALDATTGQATDWNPDPNHSVNTLSIAGNVVYVGGFFSRIGGQSRNYLAALDATTSHATNWNPNPNSWIKVIAVSGNLVYTGGDFTSIGGQSRVGFSALDATTGQVTTWNPNPNGGIGSLLVSGNVIYGGGAFTKIGGQPRKNFVAFGRPLSESNLIKGSIYEDTNGDCVKNSNEKGIANRVVVAQPGNYFTSSDSLGNYTLKVDADSYTVGQVIQADKANLIKQVCPVNPITHTIHFTGSADTVTGKDFANQTTLQSLLTVSVSSNRRRRCMTNMTTVSYCNSGTAGAENTKVHVKLPEYVVLKSANIPYTLDKEGNYVFSIGSLAANACGSISIQDSVICGNSSIRNLTQCTKAWITPANSRTPSGNWDQSDISLKAKCLDNGRVRLGMYNMGTGHMADSTAFRIYLDAQLVFTANYKLSKGDSLILQVPANGRTVRLEADQHPHHPSRKQSFITIEACGTHGDGTVSKGYVNQQTQEEEEPEIATECLPIIDSYDPNDKAVSPQGVTENHYTPTGKALDYTVRFQNTGTDVAYKVVVVDTLSSDLDISTLQVGTVSHGYKMSVSGKGKPVLTFTFDNILLPDSTRDQLGSNGFIKFSIKPKADLPEKTIIENYADIFFDFNEPIRTNTVFNSIYDLPPVVVESTKLDQSIICQTTNTTIQAGISRSMCVQDTVVMQAIAPLVGKGRWKLVRGKGVFQDRESATTLISGLAYGENVFEWSIAANSCGSDSLRSLVKITRNKKPEINILLLDSICGQGSVNIEVSGSSKGDYNWYAAQDTSVVIGKEAIFTTPVLSSSTTYYVAAVEEGCESVKVPVRVAVHKIPARPVITLVGDSLVSSIVASSYEWYLNGSKLEVNSRKIEAKENGMYTIKVIEGACTSKLSEPYTYEKVPTGIDEQASQLEIYPNPTTGFVYIIIPASVKAQVSLQDGMGRKLLTKSILSNGGQTEIPLQGIKPGMYVLIIETQGSLCMKKLLVK
ncbi:T9SS type A sorting domain-containing protein [Rhodocytophaga rosea]|uniref:T9SS type A sorting domain-containing protein n=1 Tax=Rhodocytophaga rosea TaxID=2704465 RepID=A0A6C0GDA6_9BACT|nr:T9SS type A sorting domain-containing protein [Rhodocytophaga rosea]QHT65680.1 T9SS type A sorting domain-containing protein [Rhodocytophaga rosea]